MPFCGYHGEAKVRSCGPIAFQYESTCHQLGTQGTNSRRANVGQPPSDDVAADDDTLALAFQKAIVSSTKVKILKSAALAAHFASQAISVAESAQHLFEQAKQFYLRWGARGVVEHLAKKKACSHEAFSASGMNDHVTFRLSIRCREQIDKSLAASHRCIPDAEISSESHCKTCVDYLGNIK